MGNEELYCNRQYFIESYSQLQKDFKKQHPLFDVKDIQFPLSTSGMKIVDKTGRRVKLAGVNWSGGHAERHCISGLQYRKLDDMCNEIRDKFEFNCIRLTFSLQMFYDNNKIDSELIKANPEFIGLTSMQIFDKTIQKLTNSGLMVILNNHTSKSMWCCTPWDGDGLWHTKEYPEDKFFHCLREMAKRYRYNPRVIGMDLRNQVRMNGLIAPTWGGGKKETDWRMAAEKSGNEVQQIAPHWLIIVGGIDSQLDFKDFVQHPMRLKYPNKLVYSGHFYGFSWIGTIWKFVSYEKFKQKIFEKQFFIRGLQGGVPFLLGEFGTNTQDIPWNYLMKLMEEYDLDWTYWCLDGYKCKGKQDETYGIYSRYFNDVRHPQKLRDIKKIGRPIKK